MSYVFGICRIDLTSVESYNCNKSGDFIEQSKQTSFEIEVECDYEKSISPFSNLVLIIALIGSSVSVL